MSLRTFYFITAVSMSLFFIVAILMGPTALPLRSLAMDLLQGKHSVHTLIFLDIRLPRALLALSVGFCLGLSGAGMQGLLRNPLADPGLLGVSSCAALGAVLAIYYGLSTVVWFALPSLAIMGALLSVLLMFLLVGKNGSVVSCLLAGVAINAVAGSALALALNFAPSPYAMSEMVYWLMGSFANRTLPEFFLALPFMVLGCMLLLRGSAFFQALSLGEETAQSLGFHINRQRAWAVTGVAMAVGAGVAVSGSIGFIGLLVPHLIRPLVRHHPGKLLLPCGLLGAMLMLVSDIAVQLLSPHQELKIGVVTALLGGPFFFFLVRRYRVQLS